MMLATQSENILYQWSFKDIDTHTSKTLSNSPTISAYTDGVVILNNAYCVKISNLDDDDDGNATLLRVSYTNTADNDINSLFQFGYVLSTDWIQTILHTTETQPKHDGWTLQLNQSVDMVPDCVYKMGVYMFSNGLWEVVQDTDFIWDAQLGLPMVVDGARVCTACATHKNSSVSKSGKHKNCKTPVFVLGFHRVDMGQLPDSHTLTLHVLQLKVVDKLMQEKAHHQIAQLEKMPCTHILTSICSNEQLRQPIAILSQDVISNVCMENQTHSILQCSIKGSYENVDNIQLKMQPLSATQELLAPTLYNTVLSEKDCVFSCSVNHLFNTTVNSIEVYVVAAYEDETIMHIDIVDLLLVPVALQSSVTKLYDENAGESVGFKTIESLKQDVNELRNITNVIQKSDGPPGPAGKRGAKGERGEAMRFEDLTDIQKETLRGLRGLQGPRGKAMIFDDLTQEQRVLLKGEKGDTGEAGQNGERGPPGERGLPFTFTDFTDGQLEMIRGERGLKGDKGDALTFEELSDAQKQVLRGEKGERGHKGDTGERGERGRVGPTGPIGPEGKQGPRGLPGVPGAKGDKGECGDAGSNGKHGRPAIIKTSFLSVELLRDYIQKSLHLVPNSYYIIDHPNDEEDHGKLYTYTAEMDIELTVCCSYVENIKAVLEEYQATIRTTVQTDRDEWKVLLSLQSEDISVYHLRRGLENSISQSGYLVKESIVSEDAIQHIGKLCGVQGSQGERGEQGTAGISMLGMRLDFIGTEATRLKIHEPEANSIFLQVQASKTHEAGFYIFDEPSHSWKLLQGIDVNNNFLQWMTQFVDNPHQESIPLVLSMFSTTQKQMEGHYNNVRNELQDYRNTNEKWKKYQFEHWKSMGNSQYQQFNTQLSEQSQVMETVVQQVNAVAEKSTNKDEFGILRKHVDKQNDKLERQYKSIKESLSEYTERQTVDKSVFEQEQEAVQSKLRDLDLSTLKMLKIIQFLKEAPWSKSIKLLKHEHDQHALLHSNFVVQQEKHNKETLHYIEKDCPELLKSFQDALHQLSDQLTSSGVSTDRKLAEWSDQYDRRLLNQSTEQSDNVVSLEKKIQTTLDKIRIEITSAVANKQFSVKQEILEKCNELREQFYTHEQDNKKMSQTIIKRVETSEARLEVVLKKQAQNSDANLQHTSSTLQQLFTKKMETNSKETSTKLLQTFDVLQNERKESEEQYSNTLNELQNQLKTTNEDWSYASEKLNAKMDEQRQKTTTTLTAHVDRCQTDLHKQIRDMETQCNENIATVQQEIRQQHSQHLYDLKATTKKIADVETRVADDLERKISSTKTYTDERSREMDQKYNNAVQNLTNDTHSIDAKCSAIDYTLKARMESVEEHIQQLFAEGQHQSENLVDKNKKDTLAALETLREDVLKQQQQIQTTLQTQHKRVVSHGQDQFNVHQEHLDKVDSSLLDNKRALEAVQHHQSKQHATTVQAIDDTRKELQQQMQEMYRKMKIENEQLSKQLTDTRRELLSNTQDKYSELKNEVQQKHTGMNEHIQQHHAQHSKQTKQQLLSIRSLVEGICKHMETFTQEEQAHRKLHENKLENVVSVLEKTFAEMVAE